MGITTYLFHRSDSLDNQRFNMFFLDMGENIHFHYRDLRIELSVNEFIELATLFNEYARQVLTEIDNGYRDGVLANTNESGTLKTFWDKQRPLRTPVTYHEKQLAIEETKDGYHLHIRNYKILLGDTSFRALAKAMAGVNHLLNGAVLTRDPFLLLEQNDLHPHLLSRFQKENLEELWVSVDQTLYKKASQVLQAIGYIHHGQTADADEYVRDRCTVFLTHSNTAGPTTMISDHGKVIDLPNFLATHGTDLDAEQLNQLKLKIIFLLKKAESGQLAPFRLQDIYINRGTLTPAVDMFASRQEGNPTEEIQKLTKILVAHKLFFIKPEKELFSQEATMTVQDSFFSFIHEKIACHECVRKIIVLGSMTNQRIGKYKVPFVHFDWVKINSDFDIYVELDPDYEGELPADWEKKFYWQRAGSDYYHFGDLGDGTNSGQAQQYPGVRFYEHLVEGYLFDYRHHNQSRRDAWLKEITGQCIFKRDHLADRLMEQFPLGTVLDTEPINVASFNKIYLVRTDTSKYILKHYGTKYLTAKDKERISYEIELLDALRETNLEVALPIKNNSGAYISKDTRGLTVLFTFVPGSYVPEPKPHQVKAAGRLLARFHVLGQGISIKRSRKFKNKDSLDYWLQTWQQYQSEGVVGTDIDIRVPRYRKILTDMKARNGHCHGDLSVINFLFQDNRCWLIDFQNICNGPIVADLANAMVEFSARKAAFLPENLKYMKAGYEEVRPLDAKEKTVLNDMLIIQALVRQAKLIHLHYGGFGYDLKKERLIGLKEGINHLLHTTVS